MALSSQMGSSPPYAQFGLKGASVTGTTFAIDSAFVNTTSGKCFATRFVAPVAQSSAALVCYAYLTAKTGSPTDVRFDIYAGASGAMDAQRPDTGAALATSAAVDVSAQTNNTWTTFTISSVSLTAGATYWVIIRNATGTPASNYPTYMTRGTDGIVIGARFNAFAVTDGFAADPAAVATNSDSPIVLKFSDGSVLGNPYVESTAHANNTNDRGLRFRFDASVVVVGVYNPTASNANTTFWKIYQGASEVATLTPDRSELNNAQYMYFAAPVTLAAATDYDVVQKVGSNSTYIPRLHAGSTAPADVTACMSACVSYVDGATPGSYTESDGNAAMMLLIDNFPTAAGGTSYTGMMLV